MVVGLESLIGLVFPETLVLLLVALYLSLDSLLSRRLAVYTLSSVYLLMWLSDTLGLGSGPSWFVHSQILIWGYIGYRIRHPWPWVVGGSVLVLYIVGSGLQVTSLVFGVISGLGGLAAAFALDSALPRGWLASRAERLLLGIALPLALSVFLPLQSGSGPLLMAAVAAFATAPFVVFFLAPEGPLQSLVLVVAALLLMLGLTAGSAIFVPELWSGHPLTAFLSALAVTYAGLVVVPWLAQRWHIVMSPAELEQQVSSSV